MPTATVHTCTDAQNAAASCHLSDPKGCRSGPDTPAWDWAPALRRGRRARDDKTTQEHRRPGCRRVRPVQLTPNAPRGALCHTYPPPLVVPHPREDGPPPPPGERSPSDGPPPPPLGDGHQVTVPHPPLGNRTTTVHARLQAQKLQHKTKEFSIGCVQRAANVRRPTP